MGLCRSFPYMFPVPNAGCKGIRHRQHQRLGAGSRAYRRDISILIGTRSPVPRRDWTTPRRGNKGSALSYKAYRPDTISYIWMELRFLVVFLRPRCLAVSMPATAVSLRRWPDLLYTAPSSTRSAVIPSQSADWRGDPLSQRGSAALTGRRGRRPLHTYRHSHQHSAKRA